MEDVRIGDEVLAPWQNDGFLYPAFVVALDGALAHVAFLDGGEADVPLPSVRRGCFGIGITLLVNWRGKGKFYRGVVAARVSNALYVHYEDGNRGWTTIGQCRIPAAAIDALPPTQAACSFCGAPVLTSAAGCDGCGAPRAGRR